MSIDVIVASATTEAFDSVLHVVAAIVTDHGMHACDAAIVAREMGFPAVVGAVDAARRVPDDALVRVDGTTGEVVPLNSTMIAVALSAISDDFDVTTAKVIVLVTRTRSSCSSGDRSASTVARRS